MMPLSRDDNKTCFIYIFSHRQENTILNCSKLTYFCMRPLFGSAGPIEHNSRAQHESSRKVSHERAIPSYFGEADTTRRAEAS